MSLLGVAKLKSKLASKRTRVNLRYRFYEMKDSGYEPHPVLPKELRQAYKSTSGWCAKAVDSLADRLVFDGFQNDNFNLTQIYDLNNSDVLFDSAILGALISSCDFIYISADAEGFPRLQVIDGANATGVMDPITGMLSEGYAVLDRNDRGEPTVEAYFLPYQTQIFYKGYERPEIYSHAAPYPLLVPIVYRPDAKRPFGHSRISRSCMYLQRYAKRVLERSDVSAEFYSFPQKYILGMSPEADPLEKWSATVTSLLQITADEDGNRPTAGQFQQGSVSPHLEQLRAAASAFAGETGLTLDDLGFTGSNPSSSDAIRAAHESLRLTARKAQRTFGTGFLNAGYLAACVRDDMGYKRNQLYQTRPLWAPIFEADAASLSGIGDAVGKIQAAFPEYFDEQKLRALTGI